MLKKLLIFTLLFFVIISMNVNADAFATIGQTGLTFVNPTAAAIVNGILCVLGPTGFVHCVANYVEGKIVGQVTGEVLQQVAKASPEAYKAITTYNQIKSYVDQGAQIIQDFELNAEGTPTLGSIDDIPKGDTIGNLLGLKDKQGNLRGKESAYAKKVGIITYKDFGEDKKSGFNVIFSKGEEGEFWVTTENNEVLIYQGIREGNILFNEKGIVESARFVAGQNGGTYYLNNLKKGHKLSPGQLLIYREGVTRIYNSGINGNIGVNEEEVPFTYDTKTKQKILTPLHLSRFEIVENVLDANGNIIGSKNMPIDIKGLYVEIDGNNIRGDKFAVLPQTKLTGSNYRFMDDVRVYGLNNKKGEITLVDGNVVKIKENTDAIVQGIEHETLNGDLNLIYETDKTFNPGQHKNENYFVYGKDKNNIDSKVWINGNGFISTFKEGNTIFPEYIENRFPNTNTPRSGRLEFKMNGGFLELTKTSFGGTANENLLALEGSGSGSFDIKNGKWVLETTTDNKIYAKIDQGPEYGLGFDSGSDLRINYVGRTYDLDVNSNYRRVSDENQQKISTLEDQKKEIENKLSLLSSNPKLKDASDQIKKIYEDINRLNIEKKYITADILSTKDELRSKLGTSEARESKKELDYLDRMLNEKYTNFVILSNQLNDLIKKDPSYEQLNKLYDQTRTISNQIQQYQEDIKETGFFSQVLAPPNKGVQISYDEYIQKFPVTRNVDARLFGSTSLPDYYRENLEDVDILNLPFLSESHKEEDVYITLRALYELDALKKGILPQINFFTDKGPLFYNADGSYVTLDKSGNRVKKTDGNFEEWLANVVAHSNIKTLQSNLKPITDVNELKPGDMSFVFFLKSDKKTIVPKYHVNGISEIVEIDGKKYYKLFSAGYHIPEEPHILKNVISQDSLLQLINKNLLKLYTWK